MAEVALRAALDQWHLGSEAHAVDVAARVHIVERVEHDREPLEELDREPRRLDVAVLGLDLEFIVREVEDGLARDLRLGAADVLRAEEELTIEIGVVDRVQVDHRDVAEPSQHKVLDQLTSDASGTDDEDTLVVHGATAHALGDLRTRTHWWTR